MHLNKGKTLTQYLVNRTNYGTNPNKVNVVSLFPHLPAILALLSIIDNPQKHGLSFSKWCGGHNKLSNHNLIHIAIDAILGFFTSFREKLQWEGIRI